MVAPSEETDYQIRKAGMKAVMAGIAESVIRKQEFMRRASEMSLSHRQISPRDISLCFGHTKGAEITDRVRTVRFLQPKQRTS